ncbi:MAG: hypothetical protein M3O09_13550, partial [Acidobacteriota bacterium]|nr:hypothetical protein [Acidobacteriota bacterium]
KPNNCGENDEGYSSHSARRIPHCAFTNRKEAIAAGFDGPSAGAIGARTQNSDGAAAVDHTVPNYDMGPSRCWILNVCRRSLWIWHPRMEAPPPEKERNRGAIGPSTDSMLKLDSPLAVRDAVAELIEEVRRGDLHPFLR